MALTDEAGLNQLESIMPAEAREPLHWLAEGLDYREVLEEFNDHRDEPVDTNDFMEAIERSKRRFHVVENEQELLQMLNAPLEKWRVFLHRASENWWSRPLMVRYEYWAVQVQGKRLLRCTVRGGYLSVWQINPVRRYFHDLYA